MILSRYLMKEVLSTFTAILTVLLLVFLSHQLVHYLNIAAEGRMPTGTLLKLILLEVPRLLGMLLPLGLFLSMIVAFGRLYMDNEMNVLSASGVSPGRKLRFVLPLVVTVVIGVAVLTLWCIPVINKYRNVLLAQVNADPTLQTILPGRFHEMSGGKRVVYIEKISTNRKYINHVFVAEPPSEKNPHWNVVMSAKGQEIYDKNSQNNFLVLSDGWRYIGNPGINDYQILHYQKYGVRLHPMIPRAISDEDSLPTSFLYRAANQKPSMAAELQWRVGIPLQTLLLAVLAVPLSRVSPRQGKYSRILPALLVYIVYADLMFITRDCIAHRVIAPWMGMSGLHVSMCLIVIMLFFKKSFFKKSRVMS